VTNTLDELKSLRTGLLDAIESSVRDSKMEEQSQQTPLQKPQDHDKSHPDSCSSPGSLDDQLARIYELRGALDQILAKKDTPTPEMRILQQLWFDDMYVREDKIHEAEGNTFEWILEDDQPDESITQDQDEDIAHSQEDDGDNEEEGGRDDEDEDGDDGHEESSSDSSSSSSPSRWSLDIEAMELRAHTRSTFQGWLKNGKNLFHISGKAGSGKSTLMKLIVADQRTYKFLDDWSGEKGLISGQFFFWRGGSDLQRSRQGLYRSLLFEILKQCPNLIRDVFPETHMAFEKKSRENSIDNLFFRPEHIETAFRKLVSSSPSFGYRICLFIDGLDEYGDDNVDSYEYEKLAKSLATWAENDDIKILATSRPHREFLDAFPENLRINLHEVNAHDIQLFSRHMFETDDQFELVKSLYIDLVQEIVESSAGVFLWARLVVRSLIVSIHRRDPVDSLQAQLKVAPKDLNNLYEHFFDSITKADQERAFKMLLLVAHHPMDHFNAISLSWLDYLDDPSFPMVYNMQPYTDEEIQSKHETVRRQIAGLTHGLLEMTTFFEALFFSRSIQFFHRTARDFVLENAHLQKFHAESRGLTSPDTYFRLDIAELWFSRPGALKVVMFSQGWENHYQTVASDPRLLLALAKARAYHNSDSSGWTFKGRGLASHWLLYYPATHPLPGLPESQLHYIMSLVGCSEYIKFVASQNRKLLEERDGLSCLLSALLGGFHRLWGTCLENVRCLLSLGVSPRELVLVLYEDTSNEEDTPPSMRESYIPVWSVFLVFMVHIAIRSPPSPNSLYSQQYWDSTELLLKYGAYGNSFFLFSHSENLSVPVYIISLQELIRQWKPHNQEALLQLIDKDVPSSFRSRLKKWRNIRQRNLETPFDPAQYKPFYLSMQGPSEDEVHLKYYLYSVWSAGCETKVEGLTARIY
jgi:hypothetical protein